MLYVRFVNRDGLLVISQGRGEVGLVNLLLLRHYHSTPSIKATKAEPSIAMFALVQGMKMTPALHHFMGY